MRKADGTFHRPPAAETVLEAGDAAMVMGTLRPIAPVRTETRS